MYSNYKHSLVQILLTTLVLFPITIYDMIVRTLVQIIIRDFSTDIRFEKFKEGMIMIPTYEHSLVQILLTRLFLFPITIYGMIIRILEFQIFKLRSRQVVGFPGSFRLFDSIENTDSFLVLFTTLLPETIKRHINSNGLWLLSEKGSVRPSPRAQESSED